MSSRRIRAVIVDDEPPARAKLKILLAEHPKVDLVGDAGDGLEAIRLIEAKTPDLVFLDVEMPGMSGFEVLEALELDVLPRVVFVTAFEEFAVKAFAVRAVDYLLKPVDRDRFEETLARLFDSVASASRLGRPEAKQAVRTRALEPGSTLELTRFLVRERGSIFFVPAHDVHFIEAAGNYVELHLSERSHLVRGSLKEVESRLDPSRFARIHRSTIVNLEAVESLHPFSHGDFTVVLKGGGTLRLSRRYRDRLPGRLHG